MVQDEETRFMYKEGQGRLIRRAEQNFCFYKQMIGHWSRGIIHGKRTEFQMNLDVFPSGYYEGLKSKVDNVSIVADIKKGIFNGPASILVNKKKVCKTRFQD